jgi:diacylglycerol kinase family enzyme
MYYYIYDTYLSEKKYEKTLDKIKTRLLDLEIQGKHERLTLLKSIDELISDELKKGTTTVVVVGNDTTFLKVVNTAAKNNITIGLIPVGPDNDIARTLGIPMEDASCDILAARKIVKFDLGKIKDQYFFSNLSVTKTLTRLAVGKDTYKMTPSPECVELNVYNFWYGADKEPLDPKLATVFPQDGVLELVFKVKEKNKSWFKKAEGTMVDSVIKGKKFDVKSFEYIPTLLDGLRVIKTPFLVEVEKQKLSVIVGKDRQINVE